MNALPEATDPSASGLKPIQRLAGDSRLSKIIPNTNAAHEMSYQSVFVRTFIRSDWSFCAAKFAVARRGKVKALDNAFRDAEEFFRTALAWIADKPQRPVHLTSDLYSLEMTHPYCGRLMRLMTNYDKLFSDTLFALVSMSISPQDRQSALSAAERRFATIKRLCEPDNSKFNEDGTLAPPG